MGWPPSFSRPTVTSTMATNDKGTAMSVLWVRARAQLRGRALASLLLALLVGWAARWCWPQRPAPAARRRRCPASWPPTARWTPRSVYSPTIRPTTWPRRGASSPPCPRCGRYSGRRGRGRARSSWPAPTPPTPPAGTGSSAWSPSTRAAAWRSAAPSWSPAGCPTSASPMRWPSMKSWPRVATCG
jgi:hypothetical protein